MSIKKFQKKLIYRHGLLILYLSAKKKPRRRQDVGNRGQSMEQHGDELNGEHNAEKQQESQDHRLRMIHSTL